MKAFDPTKPYENHLYVTDKFSKGDLIYQEIVLIIREDLELHGIPEKDVKIFITKPVERFAHTKVVWRYTPSKKEK